MNHVAGIPAKEEKDEPERDEDNTYNKAPDQNAGKDFQFAYETRRFIHFSPPGGAAILILMAAPYRFYAYTFFISQAMFFPRSFIVWMPSSSLRTSPISRPTPMLQ